MSLIICPECKNEISTAAEACPHCGLKLNRPLKVVEARTDESFPKWILIPGITIVALILIIVFVMLRNNPDENARNINVNMANTKKTPTDRETARSTENTPPNQITVPSDTTQVNPPVYSPPPAAPNYPSSQQNVPASSTTEVREPVPDKGTVKLEAKVYAKDGSTQSVKNEKFYLLDKAVETILSEANLEPIESNTLTNSLGLALLYPEKYGDFSRKALEVIKKHVKHDVLTDSSGKAVISNVKPDNYYLFGITKSKTGFAVWDAPVNIVNGENILTLSPANFNEITE